MAELFSRTEVDWGGAMTSQFGMVVPNKGLTGILMQNLQLSYMQNVSRLYELGRSGEKTRIYYVGGRAQGSMSAAHVVGPGVTMKTFYDNFSDVCKAQTNDCEIRLTPNICSSTGVQAITGTALAFGSTVMSYKAKYCVLVSIGVSVSAQDFVVNESSQMTFSGLEFNG